MNTEIKIIIKNVYGRDLIYPSCPTATNFADLLNVKSFNIGQLRQIEKIGYNVVNAATGMFYFNTDNS